MPHEEGGTPSENACHTPCSRINRPDIAGIMVEIGPALEPDPLP